MPVPETSEFFIDPARCIGCQSCIQACSECDTHKGQSMIQLDFVDRARSTQTVPVICMHCDSPTCAEVCPADAIKRTDDGVVGVVDGLADRGVRVIAAGTPEQICDVPESYTGRYLAPVLNAGARQKKRKSA